MTASDYRLGLLLVTGSAVAWSTAGLFARVIPLDSMTVLAWRGAFGAAGIMAAILVLERGRVLAGFLRLGWPGWSYALISGAGMICFILALRHTTVAHVAVIYATAPFVAAAMAWLFLRERPGTGAVMASLVALAGVVVMVGFGREGSLFGDLLAFGMTAALALMMVIARRWPGVPALHAACLSALLSGLVCLPFAAPDLPALPDLGLLALFGLVNSALGLTLFTLGARRLPPVETALIGALDAPLAPFWMWLAFGEVPGAATLLGGLIVFAAVAVHLMRASGVADRSGRGA